MNNNEEMFIIDVRGLFKELMDKLALIILCSILVAAGFFIYATQYLSPRYSAGFQAYINNSSSKSIIQSLNSNDTGAAETLTNTYVNIIKSRALVEKATRDAGLSYPYEYVASRIYPSTKDLTQLINVSISMNTPEEAYKLAFAMAQDAPAYMESIVMGSSMKIVDEPVFPSASYFPNVSKYTMLGALIGFAASTILLAVLFIIDDRVKNPDVLERQFDCAVIGLTPDIFASNLYDKRYGGQVKTEEGSTGSASASKTKGKGTSGTKQGEPKKLNVHKKTDKERLILSADSPWLVQEAFKKMRSNLMFSLTGDGGKIIGVTSARSHDGKTVNTVNLAISCGQIGRKVLLIEGDLRKPAVAELAGVSDKPGLSEIVTKQCKLDDAIQHSEAHGIDVISSGTLPPDPTWILQSTELKTVLDELRGRYDYVFFDLPPVITVTDAVVVAESLDGYLMVVRHGRTKLKDVDRMLSQLKLANSRIIGFVENQAITDNDRDLRNYYYKNRLNKPTA